MMDTQAHIPVLADAVVGWLDPRPGQTYFDGTAGYGGHAAAILPLIGASGQAFLVDRDEQAVAALRSKFENRSRLPAIHYMHSDYRQAALQLSEEGTMLDLVLLDLGVSSPQLDRAERGFSLSRSGPLDMRMDRRDQLTAADLVNQAGERELADVIYRYGEERRSRSIARAIVRQRPITSTQQLASVVASAARGPHQDIHPATRTFQALRIAVNRELEQLEEALPILIELLKPGGRIAVISFHSLEDRIVKQRFRTEAQDCICPPNQPICSCNHVASLKLLTKRAIKGSTEQAFNPRARSAKLRVAEKLTPKPKRRPE